jgi:hypothetical protein
MAEKINLQDIKKVKDKPLSRPAGLTKTIGVRSELSYNIYQKEERRVDDLGLLDYRGMVDNDGTMQMIINAINNLILSASFEIQDDEVFSEEQKGNEKQEDSEE